MAGPKKNVGNKAGKRAVSKVGNNAGKRAANKVGNKAGKRAASKGVSSEETHEITVLIHKLAYPEFKRRVLFKSTEHRVLS